MTNKKEAPAPSPTKDTISVIEELLPSEPVDPTGQTATDTIIEGEEQVLIDFLVLIGKGDSDSLETLLGAYKN